MAIFLVVPTVPKAEIKPGLKIAIGEHKLPNYPLPNGETLVAFRGTTKELSDTLNITEGVNGPAVIVAVGSYFGRANTDIWEWMAANWDQA